MNKYLPYMIIMSVVTYLIRMLPIVLFQKEIKSNFVKSFLYYVPYAVLGAMTFPAIFSASQSFYASIAGCAAAFYFAYKEKDLLFVAAAACITVYIVRLFGF